MALEMPPEALVKYASKPNGVRLPDKEEALDSLEARIEALVFVCESIRRLREAGKKQAPPPEPVDKRPKHLTPEQRQAIRLIETATTGTFNVVGPASPTGMQAFVHGAHAAFSSGATFVTVDDYDCLDLELRYELGLGYAGLRLRF